MDIRVNERQWNELSPQQQDQISNALQECRLVRTQDRFVADPAALPYLERLDEDIIDVAKKLRRRFPKTGKTACELACDTAAIAGAMWCATHMPGLAEQFACLAAVEASKKACYTLCK